MANPDLEKFIMLLASDSKLKGEFKERCLVALNEKGQSPYKVIQNMMVTMGNEKGYVFTCEELKTYDRIFAPCPLEDDALGNVTGGTDGGEEYLQKFLSSLESLIL